MASKSGHGECLPGRLHLGRVSCIVLLSARGFVVVFDFGFRRPVRGTGLSTGQNCVLEYAATLPDGP